MPIGCLHSGWQDGDFWSASGGVSAVEVRIVAQGPLPAVPAATEERHGKVREEGAGEGPQGNARAQGRYAAKRWLGQEGDESQAGDCDRSLRSAARRREGAAEEIGIEEIRSQEIRAEEVGSQEIRIEEVGSQEIPVEEICFKEIRFEEVRAEEVRFQEIRTEAVRREEIRTQEVRFQEIRVEAFVATIRSLRRGMQRPRRGAGARDRIRALGPP